MEEQLKIIKIKIYSLVLSGNKVLMLKKKSNKHNGYWTLPFKYLDSDKGFKEECYNNVKDKTDLGIRDSKLLVSSINENRDSEFISLGVITKAYDGDIELSDEFETYKFIDMDKINTEVYSNSYRIIEKYKENRKELIK